MSLLELHAVSKAFGSVRAVNAVDLALAAGRRMAIVGPSGCGKTTLLRLIAGFEQPDAGRIVLDGRVLAQDGAFVPAYRRGIGYLPQDGALFPHLTVEGNVAFGLDLAGAARAKRVAELMALVSLDAAMLKRWPHELSGGQQQRVALARALALQPRLMLLDEPFSALDAGLRAATRKAVTKVLSDAGIATILVTHDQAEALSFSDRLGVMRDGRLVRTGGPMDLYRQPGDVETARFLGEAVILAARLDGGAAECVLGRIAVDDPQRRGDGRIMLRAEQLELTPIPVRLDEAGCGTVVEIDYGGAAGLVTIRLDGESSHGMPDGTLVARCPSNRLPAIGDSVRIAVAGPAHVLGDSGGPREFDGIR